MKQPPKLWHDVEKELSITIFTMMEDFNSETDSDYTSYWRDWVGPTSLPELFYGAMRSAKVFAFAPNAT